MGFPLLLVGLGRIRLLETSRSLVLPGDCLMGSLITSVLGLVWRLMVLLSLCWYILWALTYTRGISASGEYDPST